MSDDDANEGTGPGECPGHDWTPTNVHLGNDGAHIDYRCTRCPAVSTQTPADLTGR